MPPGPLKFNHLVEKVVGPLCVAALIIWSVMTLSLGCHAVILPPSNFIDLNSGHCLTSTGQAMSPFLRPRLRLPSPNWNPPVRQHSPAWMLVAPAAYLNDRTR